MKKGEINMVDVKYVDEQLKVLAKRSKEQNGSSEWTGVNEFIYNNFTASRILEFSETVMTLQTAEEMLTNLEENLNQDDYSILQKENADDRVVLYIQTATHLSPVGNGAIITVVLKDNLVGIRIFEHDILNKSIDTYDLMDYIAQTIVAPSEQSKELLVNKNMFAHMQSLNEGRQVYI